MCQTADMYSSYWSELPNLQKTIKNHMKSQRDLSDHPISVNLSLAK